LIVLVILLVAAIATINIGRVSLDKTCSANAADAGSLAAASVWASAFNVLTEINKDQIKTWFDLNYFTYGVLYNEADSYLNDAIRDALLASTAAAASLAVASSPVTCREIWFYGIAAAVLDGTASVLCFEASQSTAAFSICIQFMKSLMDSFYEQQWKNYCDARSYMEDSYINARKTGLSYAFSNSCISSKLSDAQNDAFSVWMSSKSAYGNDGDPFNGTAYVIDSDGKFSRTCNWLDKLSQKHTVSATLELPNITSYELQHTVGSYSQISALLDGLISRAQTISGILNSTGVSLGATAVLFLAVFAMSIVAYVCFNCCCPLPPCYGCCVCYAAWCAAAVVAYKLTYLAQSGIVSALAAIVAAVGAKSLYSLKSNNDLAFADWAPDPDNMHTSTSCADAENLMIVKINKVTLPGWITKCSTTQQHPNTSSVVMPPAGYPTIESSSRAKFDGGDVGKVENWTVDPGDTYDPSIVGVN